MTSLISRSIALAFASALVVACTTDPFTGERQVSKTVIGAGLGGLLFDPISLFTGDGAELSRVIGMTIVGGFTGMAIGLVENALKDQWLYVASGPLAGKQFILYQNDVTVGKDQACEIYLFKDPDILDHHA